jgi:SnoaL-like domain
MSNCAFDPVAVVVDWLDACRERRLNDLLALYDDQASVRCACEGLFEGREGLTNYWSTRLERAVPQAFTLTHVVPDEDGVEPGIALDYVAYNGTPVHIRFRFTKAGKIAASVCSRGRKIH